MRIENPNNNNQHFYAGKCKGNEAPKHVTEVGEKRKVKIDKKPAIMFDSPKSKDYIYIKVGSDWLWVKDKSVFQLDTLTTMPVTRVAKSVDEEQQADGALIVTDEA